MSKSRGVRTVSHSTYGVSVEQINAAKKTLLALAVLISEWEYQQQLETKSNKDTQEMYTTDVDMENEQRIRSALETKSLSPVVPEELDWLDTISNDWDSYPKHLQTAIAKRISSLQEKLAVNGVGAENSDLPKEIKDIIEDTKKEIFENPYQRTRKKGSTDCEIVLDMLLEAGQDGLEFERVLSIYEGRGLNNPRIEAKTLLNKMLSTKLIAHGAAISIEKIYTGKTSLEFQERIKVVLLNHSPIQNR